MNGTIDTKTLEVINNPTLLNWALKIGVGNIKANGDLKELANKIGLDTSNNSVGLMEQSNVKMLLTDTKPISKPHTKIALSQLMEVSKSLPNGLSKNAVLFIQEESEKPVFVLAGKDTIAIAPRVDEQEDKPKKAKQTKSKKADEEDNEEDDEDKDFDDEED
jgi:hypothetical protein